MADRAACRQAAVAANVLAPPSLTLEQVLSLQERAAGSCEFEFGSRVDFRRRPRLRSTQSQSSRRSSVGLRDVAS